MGMFDTKTGALKLSMLSSATLILLKLGVGLSIGSVSVIAEAAHSGLDLLAATSTFLCIRIASKPADPDHPFGHGKVENLAGTVEAILIWLGAAYILYEAGSRLLHPVPLEGVEAGVMVMAFSLVTNLLVSRRLLRVAKARGSVAVEADARHLSADVYSSMGVLVGLLIVQTTGFSLLDPLVAVAVALFIAKMAFDLSKKAIADLVDQRLPLEEERALKDIIAGHYQDQMVVHDLRTRKVGSHRHIDLHLLIGKNTTVQQAHDLCDDLEKDIKAELFDCTLTIHIEPCQVDCPDCPEACVGPEAADT